MEAVKPPETPYPYVSIDITPGDNPFIEKAPLLEKTENVRASDKKKCIFITLFTGITLVLIFLASRLN